MKNIFFSFITVAFIPIFISPSFAETFVAKVGERVITMEELQRVLNSTPYAMPDAKITPDSENKKLIVQILSEIIDSELLYNEAVSLKIHKNIEFQKEVNMHRKSLLADIYRRQFLAKSVKDNPEAVKKYVKEKGVSEKMAKTIIQGEGRGKFILNESSRLFDLYKVQYSPLLAKTDISNLKDDDLLVSSTAFNIYFRDIKDVLSELGNTKNGLIDLLSQFVEVELFAFQALKEGFDKDEKFINILSEYKKNLAVVMYREQLKKKFLPDDNKIEAFIKGNSYLRFKSQTANVLLIVTMTEKEAVDIRDKAIKGYNFYELAMKNSIAPNAKANAGRIDPIIIGEHPYTSIDGALLGIKPGEITLPIKGDKGYSIFKLTDISPRELKNNEEIKTSAKKLIIEKRLSEHIQELRKTTKIEFYNNNEISN
ncbi:MAG: peptidylprolyl isomerase [Nitrospinae bacterium]|nr:peptidylprolyl isomerase [Nitrospinota bacterium]